MIRIPDSPPEVVVVDLDALEAWADQHDVGVSEVSPGHFYAVHANLATGVVETWMAYADGRRVDLGPVPGPVRVGVAL